MKKLLLSLFVLCIASSTQWIESSPKDKEQKQKTEYQELKDEIDHMYDCTDLLPKTVVNKIERLPSWAKQSIAFAGASAWFVMQIYLISSFSP